MTMTAVESAAEANWRVALPQGRADEGKATIQVKSPTADEKKEVGALDDDARQPQHQQCVETNGLLTAEISRRLDEARILAKDDKLLLAAHLLHGIDDRHLQPDHSEILREAAILRKLLRDNTTSIDDASNSGGWIKQGQHTGRHNKPHNVPLQGEIVGHGRNVVPLQTVHYKLVKTSRGQEVSCRLDTVIHSDLLVPLLSVLNESQLYATWLPNWTVPKLRVAKSEKIRQTGRVSQVIDVLTEIPWPLAARQVILKAVACDNIDGYSEKSNVGNSQCLGKEGGRILIRIESLDCHNNAEEKLNIPPVKKNTVRMKVEGGFTFEKCPADHPMAKFQAQHDAKEKVSKRQAASPSDDLVLATFSFCVDPQLRVIPQSFINFFLRVAMGQMWNMFLNVAEEVKEGKRPEHSKVIDQKREALYDWVEERTRVMLSGDGVPQRPSN